VLIISRVVVWPWALSGAASMIGGLAIMLLPSVLPDPTDLVGGPFAILTGAALSKYAHLRWCREYGVNSASVVCRERSSAQWEPVIRIQGIRSVQCAHSHSNAVTGGCGLRIRDHGGNVISIGPLRRAEAATWAQVLWERSAAVGSAIEVDARLLAAAAKRDPETVPEFSARGRGSRSDRGPGT
jgi:hypothetical protein